MKQFARRMSFVLRSKYTSILVVVFSLSFSGFASINSNLGWLMISRKNIAICTIERIGRYDLHLRSSKYYRSTKHEPKKFRSRYIQNIENRENSKQGIYEQGLIEDSSYLFFFATHPNKFLVLGCEPIFTLPVINDSILIESKLLFGVNPNYLKENTLNIKNKETSGVKVSTHDFEDTFNYIDSCFLLDKAKRKIYYSAHSSYPNDIAKGLELSLLERLSSIIEER